MNRVCAEDGCELGLDTGHVLYRVSPKGQDFVGKCGAHAEHSGPRDLEQAIERRNTGREPL